MYEKTTIDSIQLITTVVDIVIFSIYKQFPPRWCFRSRSYIYSYIHSSDKVACAVFRGWKFVHQLMLDLQNYVAPTSNFFALKDSESRLIYISSLHVYNCPTPGGRWELVTTMLDMSTKLKGPCYQLCNTEGRIAWISCTKNVSTSLRISFLY